MLVLKPYRETGLLTPLNAAAVFGTPISLWCILEQIAKANCDSYSYLPRAPDKYRTAWAGAILSERRAVFAPGPSLASLAAAVAGARQKVFLHWSLPRSLHKRRALSVLLKGYDAVIANDSVTASELTTVLGVSRHKIHNIRYGVDTEFFRPLTDISKSIDIIVPGNAYRDEQFVHDLVRTTPFKVTRLTHSDAIAESYRQLQREFPDRFSVQCGIKHVDLAEVYQSARICVLPITKASEPAGLTCLLESLACGVPVYCNHRKTLNDYVLDRLNGGYFSTVADLSAQISALTPLRETSMSHNAREFSLEHCSWQNLMRRYNDVLYRCMEG